MEFGVWVLAWSISLGWSGSTGGEVEYSSKAECIEQRQFTYDVAVKQGN